MNILAKIFKRKTKAKLPRGDRPTQRAAYPYAMATFLFFGFQGFVATMGALHLVFPELPSPISFQSGRAVHLNLSIFWPLLGIMGASLYFLVEAVGSELWKPKLATFNFWFFLAIFGGILLSLALGFTEGREYLEAIRPFDILVLISILLFLINIFVTGMKARFKSTPIFLVLLSGTLLSFLFYTLTVFFTGNPTADELLKFLVVHLWEEGSVDIMAAAILSGFFIAAGLPKRLIEKLLLLEAGIIIISGFFATGHHYYWIGAPVFWRWLGTIASILQLIPILIMTYVAWLHFKSKINLTESQRLSVNFIYASAFWNLTGTGFFGLILAIPLFSQYAHGTYLTSAHAHMALFGFLGQLVLGVNYFILFRHRKVSRSHRRRVNISMLLLNGGMVLMAASLLAAGFLQTYLWRGAGVEFNQVNLLLRPYLFGRAVGGMCFAGGGALLAWETLKVGWKFLIPQKLLPGNIFN